MEHAEGTIVIDAPDLRPFRVGLVVLDHVDHVVERRVDIRERGEGGRATEVAFEVDVPVLGKASYTLRYRYAPGGTAISWDSTEAHGAVREIRGEYLLDELEPDSTTVTYRLAVELGPLVPGFLRTEGAKRVIENALERLKRRVEMG